MSASTGDAITNMAMAIRRLLRRAGPSEIYARHVAPELLGDVHPITRYRFPHARNVLLLHASIGEPELHSFIMDRGEPIVLVYHNVTPPRYFENIAPEFAELLALGRREVELLRPRVACAIAASNYNALELESMGYRKIRVVPPATNLRHLVDIEPRASTMQHLAGFDGPLLLCVAQLMPHKRPDFLVEAMHIAETYHGMHGFLMLVGHHRLERYARAIREQVRELNLASVHVVGGVDDADLVAMFRSADAVVTASEHEGFCLPLIEAMTFDKPVVARACAAIPETVAEAALLLPPNNGPTLFAEAMTEVFGQPKLRAELVRRGRARVDELERLPPDAAIVDAVLEAV